MQVVNGKWVDDNHEPLEYHIGGKEIKALGERVVSVFGEDEITSERINIIKALSEKNELKEKLISSILENDELFNKLTGY